MKILQDGTVEIRNKTTGQTKVVSPNNLPNYGISYEKYGKELEAYNTSVKGISKGDKKIATDLRKEFRQETNDLQFKGVRDAWGRMKGAADTPTGDLSLTYSYIKLLDPNSAVREGELATTENTRGLSDTVRNSYNKVVNGKRLSAKQREGFVREGKSIYNVVAKKQKELSTFYSSLAEDAGIESRDVVGAVGDVEIEKEESFDQRKKEQPKNFFEKLTTPPPEGSQLQESIALATGPIGALLLGTERQKALAGPAVLAAGIPVAGAGLGLARAGFGALASLISPSAIAGQRSIEAIKKGDINTSKLKEAGDYFVKSIDPTVRSEWKKIRPSIKPTTSANTLLERLTAWGTKARSPRTGDLKSNAAADFYDFLRSSGRKLIKEEAPKLAEQTERLSFLKSIPKQAQKIGTLGAKAGLAAGGLAGLLGLRNK